MTLPAGVPDPGDLLRERAYVDGEWIAAPTGRSFPVHDPATGAAIGSVPDLGRRGGRAGGGGERAGRCRPGAR